MSIDRCTGCGQWRPSRKFRAGKTVCSYCERREKDGVNKRYLIESALYYTQYKTAFEVAEELGFERAYVNSYLCQLLKRGEVKRQVCERKGVKARMEYALV